MLDSGTIRISSRNKLTRYVAFPPNQENNLAKKNKIIYFTRVASCFIAHCEEWKMQYNQQKCPPLEQASSYKYALYLCTYLHNSYLPIDISTEIDSQVACKSSQLPCND